jgi:hypothetical protein
VIKSKYTKTLLISAALFASELAYAASEDEIQVYDDAINEVGELNVDVHVNYVPNGIKTRSHDREIPSHHNLRITPEFGYGLTKNWEAGLYLPFIRAGAGDNQDAWYWEGAKLRMKYLADHQDLGFYWGINFELGRVSRRTEAQNWNLEVRPIIGYRTFDGKWNLTVNPIMGIALSGNDQTPSFEPAFKVSRKVNDKTWLNLENYSDFGAIDQIRNNTQTTYVSVDTEILGHEMNLGVGHGWNNEADDWTLKGIFNFSL